MIGIEDGYEGLIMPGKNRPLALADVRPRLHHPRGRRGSAAFLRAGVAPSGTRPAYLSSVPLLTSGALRSNANGLASRNSGTVSQLEARRMRKSWSRTATARALAQRNPRLQTVMTEGEPWLLRHPQPFAADPS